MAEEQRFREGHRLCANNCGFFGSPATLNLCSKCYRDHRLREQQQQHLRAAVAVEKSLLLPTAAPAPDASSSSAAGASEGAAPSVSSASPSVAEKDAEKKDDKKAAAAGPSRCASCRKRVGPTGFRCRCGSTYCGTHRYAEQHGCTFDFKAAGRDAIALANPVVKADKLRKI